MSYNTNSFPTKKNGFKLTTGTHTGNIILCRVAGSFTYNWIDGGTGVEECEVGDSFDLQDAISVTITSGAFHVA